MKFRIYDSVEKKYPERQCDFLLETNGRLLVWNGTNESILADPDRYTVEWCIGLPDKNGVEIFEGDIVRWIYDDPFDGKTEYKKEVVYSKEWGQFCADIFDFRTHIDKQSLEITGNIHDNPELLEESK